MRMQPETQPPGRVNPKILHGVFITDQICLIAVAIVALANLFSRPYAPVGSTILPAWLEMPSSFASMALCAALSLFCSEETQRRWVRRLGTSFGAVALMIAAGSFAINVRRFTGIAGWTLDHVDLRQGSPAFSAGALLVLAIAILLAGTRRSWLRWVENGFACLLFFLALTLVFELVFRVAGVGVPSAEALISFPTLACLALLTAVVIFRRSEGGALSILWGYGTGSRVARVLAPILLVLPLLREIARAHLLNAKRIPTSYTTGLLTAIATSVAFILLFILARAINDMQQKLQDVTMRDGLTGLLSVRGFYLLAEQAFRHSRRSGEPFGVLFIDMDNLKKINDELGHSLGSLALVETAKLLVANLRKADVIGRVGGDEFVVAGPFGRHEIAKAIERIRAAVARKNEAIDQRFSIGLSIGHAVAEDPAKDTLEAILLRADEAMYAEKRLKKNVRIVTDHGLPAALTSVSVDAIDAAVHDK